MQRWSCTSWSRTFIESPSRPTSPRRCTDLGGIIPRLWFRRVQSRPRSPVVASPAVPNPAPRPVVSPKKVLVVSPKIGLQPAVLSDQGERQLARLRTVLKRSTMECPLRMIPVHARSVLGNPGPRLPRRRRRRVVADAVMRLMTSKQPTRGRRPGGLVGVGRLLPEQPVRAVPRKGGSEPWSGLKPPVSH